MTPALHGDVAFLAFLLGTWRGEGRGSFPTIDPFAYREELVFEHVGEPYLLYQQESFDTVDGAALHLERGFLRPGATPDSLELCLAHPLGLTEVAHGELRDGTIELPRRFDAPMTATERGWKNGSSEARTATWSRAATCSR